LKNGLIRRFKKTFYVDYATGVDAGDVESLGHTMSILQPT